MGGGKGSPNATATEHDRDLAGLDALELPLESAPSSLARTWSAAWPKLAAIGLFLAFWQVVVWVGWKPTYVLPAPGTVFGRLLADLTDGVLLTATRITLSRALIGYGIEGLVPQGGRAVDHGAAARRHDRVRPGVLGQCDLYPE